MKSWPTRRGIAVAAVALWSVVAGWPAAEPNVEPNLDRASALYQQTEYRQALQIIEPAQPKTASTYQLLGQCYYMLEDYKKASEAFEKAVSAGGRSSVAWDWLGRAYGKRAENAFALIAPSYASKARQNFEKAVELDPNNLEAVDDLFEYYLEAPGLLGGGMDKAAQLSSRIRERAPALYHNMQARIAEKNKQFAIAEQHWRAAAEAAPATPGSWIELARFLARQGRYADSDAAFDRASQLAPDSARLKFHRARSYIESNRNLAEARKLLQEYLVSALTPDDPPRSEAQKLLQKLAKG